MVGGVASPLDFFTQQTKVLQSRSPLKQVDFIVGFPWRLFL